MSDIERFKTLKFALLCFALSICLSVIFFISYEREVPFERFKWIELENGDRHQMAGYLVKHSLLDGMRREDVLHLLGKPDEFSTGSSSIVYMIKHGVSGFLDTKPFLLLEIKFCDDGVVCSYAIRGT